MDAALLPMDDVTADRPHQTGGSLTDFPGGESMGVAEVSNVLWREREQLELLLFKLEEEQLVLTSGKTRWLAHATREVEIVLEQVRQTELLRAVEVDDYAAFVGLNPSPSLHDLALVSDEIWRDLLIAHRDALVEMTAAIGKVSAFNRQELAIRQRGAHETLLSISGQLETYAPSGRTTAPAPSRLVDQAL